jgi:hypothetical protein
MERVKALFNKRCMAVLLLLVAVGTAAGRNVVFSQQIKSVSAVVGSDWLSPPVLTLGSDETLNVGFDEMSHNYHRFVYAVEHCEDDWSKSEEMFESDYLAGFNNNPIDDYRNSINTIVQYTHYSFSLPNDRCQLKMSGNYRLTVYDEDNGNEPVLQVEFMVVEPLMKIALEGTTNTDVDVNKSHQQIAVHVDYGTLAVTNHDEQLRLVVTQNDRADNARRNIKPNFVSNKGMEWRHNKELVFDAGNEYHKYEALDVSHPTMGIERMEWDGNNYHAYTFVSEDRRNYLYDVDANGAFYIRNSDNVEIDYSCEYLFVHYKLKTAEVTDGRIVIDGWWTNDADSDKYAMEYDSADGSYNAALLQKQGYYSYQYLLKTSDGRTLVPPSEGSFYQTENRYQAYIYYKETGGRTWRLVGYRQLEMK